MHATIGPLPPPATWLGRPAGRRPQPPHERPRERLAGRGAASLSDAELVAVVLGSGSRGRTAIDVAQGGDRALRGHRRPRARVARAGWPRSPASAARKAARIAAGFEIARRVARARDRARRPDDLARRGPRLPALRARPGDGRGVRRPVPRQPAPADRVVRTRARDARADQRLPARGGQGGARAQRRRGDLRAQPPVRRRRALARRRAADAGPAQRALARRRAHAGPLHRRRARR